MAGKNSTFGSPAVAAFEASFLVNQRFLTADGAFLAFGFGLVGQVFFQRPLHTVLPGIDGLTVELQSRHQFDHLINRHAVTQYSRNQLGIILVFGIELAI